MFTKVLNLVGMKIKICLALMLYCSSLSAQLRLSAFFGDHMVLQRDKPVNIWGLAKPGEIVNITIGKIHGSVAAGKDGKWKISLPSFSAGGPYVLSVQTKSDSKVFSDILFGEVWICSGQSNMEFNVKGVENAKLEISQANNNLIRQVSIPKKLSLQTQDFIDSTGWVISTPNTTGEFSAVGYFFARAIYEQLKIPVGLINDNWGGSQVESWISKEAMMTSAELKNYAEQMPANWAESEARINQRERESAARQNGGKMPLISEEDVLNADYNFEGWFNSAAPGNWDWMSLSAFRGQGYMTRSVHIDSGLVSQPSMLSLGTNDSKYRLFINGKLIQEGKSRIVAVQIPPFTWKPGKNRVLLEQGEDISEPWMGMGIHGSAEQIFVSFGEDIISLADNEWMMMARFDKPHYYTHFMNNEGTAIYNAMIHPLVPLSIKGVLWYQGESNASRAYEYRKTFPLLIESWRKEWNDDFPFLYVQLSSFGSDQNSNIGSEWAELREAQSKTLSLENTGMAVTTDIGNPKDIHPKNKQDVGKRLAVIALNNVYGVSPITGGPVYDTASFSIGQVILSFKSIGKGLAVKDRYGYLRGFEIAGTDRRFYFAQASIRGNQVIVSCDSVSNPVAVRYGWTDAPSEINLFNLDGFPASPFRTDDWPCITRSTGFFNNNILLLF
jgi:sialate O-acetylesterase